MGKLAEPYQEAFAAGSPGIARYYYRVFLASLSDSTVLTSYAGARDLQAFNIETGDQWLLGRIPERFRKGQPDTLWQRFAFPNRDGGGLPHDWSSDGVGMWVLSDGRIAVVHIDNDYRGEPPQLGFDYTPYLTVLDPQEDTACIDLPLPIGDADRPVFDVQGDVLYALERRLTTGLSSELWLLQFPVPLQTDCPEEHRGKGWLQLTSE